MEDSDAPATQSSDDALLEEVLQNLDGLRFGSPNGSADCSKGHIPHHPIIILGGSDGLIQGLPTPAWGHDNSEQDYADVFPQHLRLTTTVVTHDSKRLGGTAYAAGFLTSDFAREAYEWMLLENAKYGYERFRFLHSRDPRKGGRNVRTDHCRIGVVGARGLTKDEAAGEARGYVTHALKCTEQHTIMEPYVPADVAVPWHVKDPMSSTEFIVYITFRSFSLARRAATALKGVAIIGPDFSKKFGKDGCRAVTIISNWPAEAKCERCSEKIPEGSECPCDFRVISVQLDTGPIHERVLKEMAGKLKAHEHTFGSSRRKKLRRPQRWATLHVRIPNEAAAEEILRAYVEMEYISAYYIGLSLSDPSIKRCNACGLRDADCVDKGPNHLQAHEAGDRLKCPFHTEAPAELKRLEGWPRWTGRPQKPRAEQTYVPASSATHVVTKAPLSGSAAPAAAAAAGQPQDSPITPRADLQGRQRPLQPPASPAARHKRPAKPPVTGMLQTASALRTDSTRPGQNARAREPTWQQSSSGRTARKVTGKHKARTGSMGLKQEGQGNSTAQHVASSRGGLLGAFPTWNSFQAISSDEVWSSGDPDASDSSQLTDIAADLESLSVGRREPEARRAASNAPTLDPSDERPSSTREEVVEKELAPRTQRNATAFHAQRQSCRAPRPAQQQQHPPCGAATEQPAIERGAASGPLAANTGSNSQSQAPPCTIDELIAREVNSMCLGPLAPPPVPGADGSPPANSASGTTLAKEAERTGTLIPGEEAVRLSPTPCSGKEREQGCGDGRKQAPAPGPMQKRGGEQARKQGHGHGHEREQEHKQDQRSAQCHENGRERARERSQERSERGREQEWERVQEHTPERREETDRVREREREREQEQEWGREHEQEHGQAHEREREREQERKQEPEQRQTSGQGLSPTLLTSGRPNGDRAECGGEETQKESEPPDGRAPDAPRITTPSYDQDSAPPGSGEGAPPRRF